MARRKPLSPRVDCYLRAKAKNTKKYNFRPIKKSFYRRGQGAWLGSGSRPRIPMLKHGLWQELIVSLEVQENLIQI